MTVRVLVLDDYQDVARRLGPWADLAGVVEVDLDVRTTHLEAAELRDALAPAQVVVAMRERTPLPRSVLAQAPNLKLVVTTGMANAAIDIDACHERGIEVRGTGGLRTSTAELTWGLILALTRHICAEDRGIRGGGWQHTLGLELRGARLGVVGLGHLGEAVARVGIAFGMDVVAWSQHLTTERAQAVGVAAVSKAELLSSSDIVTLHLKLSERTRAVIGAAELAAMKPTAYLVNTSRGPLIDESALVAALHADTIAGAGLDVFDVEPLPLDHPLRSAPNTVLTPHIGYVTDATYEVWWRHVVEDVRAWASRSQGPDADSLRLL
ncbi:MAG: D-2-hydroxyacid dehydrogenase family protein [Acidothermaceae bacterium]